VAAQDLKAGDKVRQASGGTGTVIALLTTQETQTMFNLDVAELDNYYVGEYGWLVHNADRCFTFRGLTGQGAEQGLLRGELAELITEHAWLNRNHGSVRTFGAITGDEFRGQVVNLLETATNNGFYKQLDNGRVAFWDGTNRFAIYNPNGPSTAFERMGGTQTILNYWNDLK
jgi:hypothetical protein